MMVQVVQDDVHERVELKFLPTRERVGSIKERQRDELWCERMDVLIQGSRVNPRQSMEDQREKSTCYEEDAAKTTVYEEIVSVDVEEASQPVSYS